jgi:hypothetical protein
MSCTVIPLQGVQRSSIKQVYLSRILQKYPTVQKVVEYLKMSDLLDENALGFEIYRPKL